MNHHESDVANYVLEKWIEKENSNAMSAKNIAVVNIQKNYAFAMIVLRKVLSKSNLLFSF